MYLNQTSTNHEQFPAKLQNQSTVKILEPNVRKRRKLIIKGVILCYTELFCGRHHSNNTYHIVKSNDFLLFSIIYRNAAIYRKPPAYDDKRDLIAIRQQQPRC